MNGEIIAAKSHQPCFTRFSMTLTSILLPTFGANSPAPEAFWENSKMFPKEIYATGLSEFSLKTACLNEEL